ncbi:GMC family oxidoreductase [Arthrobacter sp. MMS24-S77]
MTAPKSAIVVGAGSAGCVVARRLVDAGVHVRVLEAGGEDSNPAIHDPSRMGELWHSADDWDYYTVPQEHASGRRLHLPRGKVLGGSHSLNAMIWVRCAPADFDHWAAEGNDGWSWADVLPVYQQIEAFPGEAGMLDVSDDYPLDPIQGAVVDAAVEIGLERNPNYNSGQLDGVSQQQLTIRDGKRLNTYIAYLKPVLAAPNVDLETGCHVHRLLLEDGRVSGVEYERRGELLRAYADEVILCAGAIDSPRILLRSGIGPAEELTDLGIAPVHDLPGVGKNLHDHLLAPVIFTTTREIDGPRPGVSITQSHLFWKSRPDLDVPDTQPIHFSVPMYQDDMTGPDSNAFTLMAGIVSPSSRGSIRLSGSDPRDPLLIDLAALNEEEDVRSLVASVRQCRAIGAAPALVEAWGAQELYPGPAVVDDEGLRDYVRRRAVTYHHQVGSCKMGVDALAVVDPRLRVHGLAGLRIADASIMPRITTGNTNAPSIMIGEKAAKYILED